MSIYKTRKLLYYLTRAADFLGRSEEGELRPGSKITLDGILAVAFIAALGFHVTGGGFHEWIGLIWSALIVVHCWWNRCWFTVLFKGKYTLRRTADALVILILAVGLVGMTVSGIMNSSYVFTFMEREGGLGWRKVHSFAAYWSLVFIGVHVGLRWRSVSGIFQQRIMRTAPSGFSRGAVRMSATAIMLFGVWASFDRAMGTKLFAGASFDFWDTDRPDILFFAAMFAILGMYAMGIHYLFSAAGKRGAALPTMRSGSGIVPGTVESALKNEEQI